MGAAEADNIRGTTGLQISRAYSDDRDQHHEGGEWQQSNK